MSRKPKKKQEFQCYQLSIVNWAVGYSASRLEENPHKECLDLALDVELSDPIKGVSAGQITLFGSSDQGGGYLKYNVDKTLHGALWISFSGAATLVTVLTAGQQIILDLYGEPFRYRSAAIRDASWYTQEHPSIEEL